VTDADSAGEGDDLDPATRRRVVRERYGRIADGMGPDDGCGSGDGCCGDPDAARDADGTARRLGYAADDLDGVAGEANLGLGCGNPRAIAALAPGETVLDLGSGAGFDCFLAAREVGPDGRVIGVDMTPEMVERARENAREADADGIEFRLGEIEHLPVADASVDAVISNCVVNLSPDIPQVFREAHRVLRPGGRLAISDVVVTAEVPAEVRADPDSVAACVAGASTAEEVERALVAAGFEDVGVAPKDDGREIVREWDDDRDLGEFLVSARITGRKPAGGDRAEGGEVA
jgi:SAM-dependent methyltransferase